MTPQEKATDIFNKMFNYRQLSADYTSVESVKVCALIAVDEILKITSLINDGCGEETTLDYWEQVKTEIEKL